MKEQERERERERVNVSRERERDLWTSLVEREREGRRVRLGVSLVFLSQNRQLHADEACVIRPAEFAKFRMLGRCNDVGEHHAKARLISQWLSRLCGERSPDCSRFHLSTVGARRTLRERRRERSAHVRARKSNPKRNYLFSPIYIMHYLNNYPDSKDKALRRDGIDVCRVWRNTAFVRSYPKDNWFA